MIEAFKNTPIDIVINILCYSGIIKYRYGKFMNTIANNDKRYKMLSNVSPIKTILYNSYPIRYERNLGRFIAYLKIDNWYEHPKYRFIFQRKREKDDTSSICLYYYKLK
jgi:hypothetical protein